MWTSRKSKGLGAVAVGVCVAIVSVAIVGRLGRGRAVDDAQHATVTAPDRFALEEGGRLYTRYCAPCHGESGKGDGRFYASSLTPAPADFTDAAFSRSDQRLREAIVDGSRNVGRSELCPPWGRTLSPADVDYVVAYIRQLQHGKERAPAGTFD